MIKQIKQSSTFRKNFHPLLKEKFTLFETLFHSSTVKSEKKRLKNRLSLSLLRTEVEVKASNLTQARQNATELYRLVLHYFSIL